MPKQTNKFEAYFKTYEHEGETYSYPAIHAWLKRKYGKATRCDNVNCLKISNKYQWSNISHEYKKDISDWQQLCASCHAKYDFTENTRKALSVNSVKGKEHYRSKAIVQLDIEGQFIKEWDSLADASRELGLDRRRISDVLTGRCTRSGQWIWRYADTNKMS